MDGWTDGWTDKWADKWADKQMDRRKEGREEGGREVEKQAGTIERRKQGETKSSKVTGYITCR